MPRNITAYVGLGSNLGERAKHISDAAKMLAKSEGVQHVCLSRVVETAPLGGGNQPAYLNAVAEVRTTLDAGELFAQLTRIENSLGRERGKKWASRTIDIDLLFYGDSIINQPGLTVPHRQMHLRSFVLNGLIELNPNLVHPGINQTVTELGKRLRGRDFVLNHKVPELIGIAGIIGVGKTTLAKGLAEIFGCNLLLEAYDTNPFLRDVYAGKREAALDSELYFLTSRLEQLSTRSLRPGEIVVSDYIFEKGFVYAKHWLDDSGFTMFKKIAVPLTDIIAKPVLVIYLKDLPEVCMERIHKRNRPYEQGIGPEFLEELDAGYEKLFADWAVCPIIELSTAQFDCRETGDVEKLANEIRWYVSV